LLRAAHQKYKSYGYHRLAVVVQKETGWIFSHNLAHKCCKYAGIKSKAKHYKYKRTGQEHILYPNLVKNNWNSSKPLELVASDMTCIKYRGRIYEWVYILDIYNNEILTHHLSEKSEDRNSYFFCLNVLVKKIEEQINPVVLHTDQGSIYSSRAFAKAHDHCNIIRSMSRAGTPTDNPVIESINGWIKEELRIDFRYWENDDLFQFMDRYVQYYNHERPAYSLNYQSPVQYRTERGFG